MFEGLKLGKVLGQRPNVPEAGMLTINQMDKTGYFNLTAEKEFMEKDD